MNEDDQFKFKFTQRKLEEAATAELPDRVRDQAARRKDAYLRFLDEVRKTETAGLCDDGGEALERTAVTHDNIALSCLQRFVDQRRATEAEVVDALDRCVVDFNARAATLQFVREALARKAKR